MLRLLMMPLMGQHDVMFMPWMSRFINQGHPNLYSFLYENFGEVVMNRPGVWAPYPYGFYIFTSGWLGLLEKVGAINLATWDNIWEVPYPARYVFLFKLPYLFFDFVIGYILYRTGGRVALTLWALSPTAIYTPFMMGQNDIYATAFVILGVHTAAKSSQIVSQSQTTQVCLLDKWALCSSIFLGIGAIFKSFPLFLLPPLAIVTKKNWKSRLFLIFLSCLIFGVFALPFLTTPTFVDGVLLNPEGANIFRQVQLFGLSVSPFLVSYVILISLLITRGNQFDSTQSLWFACLATMALLFLWVPAQFYWLIWITPLLIGVVNKSPKLLLAWFALQLAFAFIALAQPRELGVALPIHLSNIFNVPNLPTTLALTRPLLSRMFITIWPLVNSLLLASLLLLLWCASRTFNKQYQPHSYSFRTIILGTLPIIFMLSGLVVNLYLARHLVSFNNYYPWQNHTLYSTEDFLVQELDQMGKKVTGIRLRFADASPETVLKVCLFSNNNLNQEPIDCISRSTSEHVENQALYFIFDNVLSLESGSTPTVKIQLEEAGTTVTLPYSTVNTASNLQFNNMLLRGTLDMSILSPFSLREALQGLVVENILQDGWLLFLIGITGVLVFLFIVALFSKSQHSSNADNSLRGCSQI